MFYIVKKSNLIFKIFMSVKLKIFAFAQQILYNIIDKEEDINFITNDC